MKKDFLISSSLIFLVLLASSCASNIARSDLKAYQGYYYVNSEYTYTGEVFTYYKNGNIESKGYMKNGIPVNTFEYYVYSNELITKEDYKHFWTFFAKINSKVAADIHSTEKLKNNVIRGYILISNENGVLFSSLNFIVLKENYNSINLNQIKTVYNRLISYHGINQIKFKECEFEPDFKVYDIWDFPLPFAVLPPRSL